MKIQIKIRWNRDICVPVWAPPEFYEGQVSTLDIPCDKMSNHADLLDAIETIVGEFVEHADYSILDEQEFWSKLNEQTKLISARINKDCVQKSLQVLIDNGIEEDEAETVLQALGYTLLGVELSTFFD